MLCYYYNINREEQMKKQTKKHILEFLHFWPMTIVVPILLLLILFPGIAGATILGDGKVSLILDLPSLMIMSFKKN